MSEEAAQDIADAINSGALQPYFDELAKKKERVVLEPPVPGSIPREEMMEAVAKVRLAEKPRSQCTCSCHSYPEGTVKHMFPCCRPDTAIDHIVKA